MRQMLSPGQQFRKVPKEIKENLRFRRWLLGRAGQSRRVREGLIEACRSDILFYTNAFVWTFDPRTRQKFLPFVTYPFQDKAVMAILDAIEQGRDLVIEKTRDMGASWMSLLVMEWLWHFHPGHSFLMVSRKEDLVDAPGDPDSLFWKVDFMHKYLPDWLRPETDRRKLHFGNLRNGSTIDGESTTAAAGVGGRRTAMFIDEFSRIEEGYQLLAGTADTTRCRIFNFTPYGTSNAAYKLARRTDVRKLRLHWSEHPEKARGLYQYDEVKKRVNLIDPLSQDELDAIWKSLDQQPPFNFILDGKIRSPWYDFEWKRRANAREVAQMLDIDYTGSSYQFFDKGMIGDLQRTYAIPPVWEGDISFDADTGKPLELVKHSGGPLKLWMNPDAHGRPPPAPYAGGADICSGTGATNSIFSLIDCRTGEKVLEYANPFARPEAFAVRVVAICRLFKDVDDEPVLFAWEMQGPGAHFGKRVIELGYRNVYYRKNEQSISPKANVDTPGWFPSSDNRRTLLEEYRAALSTRQFVNRSFVALEECLAFVFTARGTVEHDGDPESFDATTGKQDPSGAGVNHGDRVIADALAWKMAAGRGTIRRGKETQKVQPGSLAWRRQLSEAKEKEAAAWG